jgi:hypothetical protein
MRNTFPIVVASLSAFCTVGCGGGSPTTVTPASADPATGGASAPAGGSGSPIPNPTPTPMPGPTPGPTPTPTPTPTPAGEFSWTVESSGRAEPVSAIWAAGARDVWAVSGHGVVHSAGDGAWATVHEDPNDEYQAVLGADGWIFVGGLACSGGVCQGGILLRSSDGGATWAKQTIGSGVSGFSAVAGSVYADSGDVYASSDHFATTTTIPLGWATSYGVFADGGALYAYGGLRGAQIRRTSDGGQTWTTVYSGFSGSQSGYMNALTRGGSAMFALANGCSVPACLGAVFRSLDGGDSWVQASIAQDWVSGVWAASADEIYVGGTALVRSTDGAASFAKVSLPVDKSILALWGVSANELYAVGQDGTILHGRR